MNLLDNNVLISAFRPELEHHQTAKSWLEDALNAGETLKLFPTVEVGFLRVVTNGRIFDQPSAFEEAWEFLSTLSSAPSAGIIHWSSEARTLLAELCLEIDLKGNDCNDALLAAVAIERRLSLVTFDKGFRRFPKLRLELLV